MTVERRIWDAAPEFRLLPVLADRYCLGRKAEFRSGISTVAYESIAHCASVEEARRRIAEFQRAIVFLNSHGEIVHWGEPTAAATDCVWRTK